MTVNVFPAPATTNPPNVMLALDLGTVTVADLLANGPRTLYTPSTGEFIDIKWGVTHVDLDHQAIYFEPYTSFIDPGFGSPVQWIASSNNDTVVARDAGTNAPAGLYFPVSPVIAYLEITSLAIELHGPVGTWAIDTSYSLGDAVLDGAGHIQVATTAGTSAHTGPPSFDDSGGTTAEGPDTLVWTDGGLAPTQGSVQVVALVGKPV